MEDKPLNTAECCPASMHHQTSQFDVKWSACAFECMPTFAPIVFFGGELAFQKRKTLEEN